MSKLKEKLMLSEKGYSDLKKAITACTITNAIRKLLIMIQRFKFSFLIKISMRGLLLGASVIG